MDQKTHSSFKYSVKNDQAEELEKLNSNKNSNRSDSDEIVNASLSLYRKLESRINDFEGLEFPPLQLPTMRVRPKRKKKCKKREKVVKDYQPSRVVTKICSLEPKKDVISGSAVYSTYKEALGPGKYEHSRKISMPGGIISSLPRFENILNEAEDFIHNITNRGTDKFICKNLDLSPCYRDKKLEIIKEHAKIREFEEAVHKKTKACLDDMKKETVLKKYSQKMSKFEWRLRIVEIQAVKKSWGFLLIAFGFASGIKSLILNKIARNKRILKNFRLLSWLCRFVGKIMRRLNKYRWKILIKAVNKHLPQIKKWSKKRINLYRGLVTNIIERALMGDYMTELMRKFIKNVKIIQCHFRNILKIKRARNWGLSILFSKIERQLNQSRGGKRNMKEKTNQLNIDEEIRKYYIQISKEFTEKMKIYKVQKKAYEENLNKVIDEKSLMISFDSIEVPQRPKFILFSRYSEITKRLRISSGLDTSYKLSPTKKIVPKSPALRRQSLYK